ncbi:hypothetical protein MIR68_006718 [Amoeboaphelidium protococcarum]|nr:hypothetical protein MIR68_006718 [Amoeboaphelidium protococcarum]
MPSLKANPVLSGGNIQQEPAMEQQMRQRRANAAGFSADGQQQLSANELLENELLNDYDNGVQGGKGDSKKKGKTQSVAQTQDWLDNLLDGVFRYDAKTYAMVLALSIVSIVSRVWSIGKATFVVWDEAHFGKFASHYLKREFYFDVHPPLGKMLVGFAGLLAGYKGDFDFESGKQYPEGLNYTTMRVFLSMFGAFMVPLAYLTCLEFGLSKRASFMAAIMVLCDNAYLAISRYILLDSMLLFFTVYSFYCLSVFYNCRRRPFTAEWWFWLAATGSGIGMVSSVKWVGFFVTATIGLYTIEDLWDLFGDVKCSPRLFIKHFTARSLCLIALPIAIYMFSFWVHFKILAYSGPGDAQMSSLFQANLIGNTLHESPLYIAYGSKVTLKNNGYGGGLLHSHVQTFPHGSKQQQVTCYHHKDANNDWIIKRIRGEPAVEEDTEIHYLKDGDQVRLMHASTGRNLHSHAHAAPISKWAYEVSGYGNETIGDANDYWRVEVVDDVRGGTGGKIRSLSTRLRFRHKVHKCLLRSHNVNLPEWGFKQAEVVCDKYNKTDLYNIWNVESHWNDKMEPGTKAEYKTSFIKDFIHLNVGMYTSNNALTPDPDKEPDGLTSLPSEWPWLNVGLRMCGWGDDVHKVLLLGNPAIWWGGTASLILYGALTLFYALRWKRGYKNWNLAEYQKYFTVGKYFVIGWALHYLPFMIMARVTYLHHYFPALYFSILSLAFITEHIAARLPRTIGWVLWASVLAASVVTFYYFAPLSFGFDGPSKVYKDRMWRKGWKVTDI